MTEIDGFEVYDDKVVKGSYEASRDDFQAQLSGANAWLTCTHYSGNLLAVPAATALKIINHWVKQ